MIRRLVVASLALAACTEHVQLGDDGKIPGLTQLLVTPQTASFDFDSIDAAPQVRQYMATGIFDDGARRDVTALVDWTTNNPAPGGFLERGVYTATGAAAGHVVVQVRAGDVVGNAAVTVEIAATIVDNTFPPPANAAGLFAGAAYGTDPTRTPSVLYPSHDTLFPQQLARILFQHARGTSNDTFRIAFDSELLHLVVLTGGDRWQPDDAVWQLIERSNPAGSVQLAVEALSSSAPMTKFASTPITLRFAGSTSSDVVYYFSNATSGVVRGSFPANTATQLYPVGVPQCAGCHAVSRDGSTMALGYGGENLATIDVESLAPLVPPGPTAMGWATFSPDDKLVLVANSGELILRDANTGVPVGPTMGKLKLPVGMHATHPDWSPDGTSVAVALAPTISNMDLKGGAIALIPYAAGVWGNARILVTSSGDNDNNFFPRWSPDGKYIAYVHADSASQAAKTAELRLVNVIDKTSIPLRIANHRVGRADDVPNLASTMPSWTSSPDGLSWIAFTSIRPYGAIRPLPGPSQIWVAGVDLARDGDPSFSAFWLPCQDVTSVGNNPVWAPLPTGTH